jgi:outer membrane protein OmpA-like peptidoglycan-associated protein
MVDNAPSFEFQSVLDQFDEELPSCSNPVISGGGDLLIFLVDYPNDKKIMESRKEGDYWSRPKVINSYLGMVGETVPVSLSYDGKELYLMHQFYSHSDIFVSRYENGRWTEAEALGHQVNGRTSETHASISRDGQTLYFVSDKRGGQGSLDIFVSRKDEKGEWGEPRNLGPVVNTEFEERTPFISANDSILFFSSQGHNTIGGLDVFYSELGPDGQWGEPVNLGFPVNTTDDNVFFNPGWNEMDGYYAMRREDDPTSNTINMVIELEPQEMLAEEMEVEEPGPEDEPVAEIQATEQAPATEEAPAIADEQPSTAASPTVGVVALPLLVEDEEEEESALEEAIEPEETDDIHLALNNGDLGEDTGTVAPNDVNEAHLSVVPVQGSTVLVTSVPFDHNKHSLSLGAILEAERIADLMTRYPESTAKIIGHADETGAADYNMMISHQRAETVLGYLEIRGVDTERITLEARGEHSPAALVREADGSRSLLGLYVNRQVRVCVQNPLPMKDSLGGFYVPSYLMRVELAHQKEPEPIFTVQVKAAKGEIPASLFGEMEGIREYVCDDGFYRYAVGEFPDLRAAKASLEELRAEGYPDAFIQTLIYYQRVTQKLSKPGP